jgi:hypothetical protein
MKLSVRGEYALRALLVLCLGNRDYYQFAQKFRNGTIMLRLLSLSPTKTMQQYATEAFGISTCIR